MAFRALIVEINTTFSQTGVKAVIKLAFKRMLFS